MYSVCVDFINEIYCCIITVVAINEVEMNGQTFNWTIISRRSVDKAGTRFYSRGINDQGKVANFVETEQIIEFNGHSISFLQVIVQ